MWFWIKHLSLAVILLAAAVFLLLDEEWKMHFNMEEEKPTSGRIIKPTVKTEDEKQDKPAFGITKSKAADGLSNFYGKVKEELLGTSKTMGDGFVLRLDPQVYSVDEQLQRRGDMVQPGPAKFTGEVESRHFRSGDTIKSQLEYAAEKEGMELIWRLERDYVIKHYFQVESNLLSTIGTVASALDSDYEHDVYAFYCFKQRAVLITHEVTDFIRENCSRAGKKPKLANN